MAGPFGHKSEEMAYGPLSQNGLADGRAGRQPTGGCVWDRCGAYNMGYQKGVQERREIESQIASREKIQPLTPLPQSKPPIRLTDKDLSLRLKRF